MTFVECILLKPLLRYGRFLWDGVAEVVCQLVTIKVIIQPTPNRVESYPSEVISKSSRNIFKLALIISYYLILYAVLTMNFQENIHLM